MKYFGCGFEVGFLPYSLSTPQWCLCPEGRSVRLLAISSLHTGLDPSPATPAALTGS